MEITKPGMKTVCGFFIGPRVEPTATPTRWVKKKTSGEKIPIYFQPRAPARDSLKDPRGVLYFTWSTESDLTGGGGGPCKWVGWIRSHPLGGGRSGGVSTGMKGTRIPACSLSHSRASQRGYTQNTRHMNTKLLRYTKCHVSGETKHTFKNIWQLHSIFYQLIIFQKKIRHPSSLQNNPVH